MQCGKLSKYRRVVASFAGFTLLFLVGRLLEMLLTKTIKDIKTMTPADKASNTAVLTEDIFSKAAERQETRKQQLKNYCQEHDITPPSEKQLEKLLIDDENKYIYCTVPKVASTPMKMTLLSLRNNSGYIFGKSSPHAPRLWRYMTGYKTVDVSKRLVTHFKFLFVREPFHRLLSAYRDKFFGKNRIYTNRFRKMIVEAFRPRDIETVGMATNNVTFTEFLKYIVTYTGYMTSNDHWQKYEQLCFPCAFEYDFIGHFETLEEDAVYLLKKAGIDDRVAFPPVRLSRATSDFMTYYSQVPHEVIFKLGEAFKPDFEMFGYPFPGPFKNLLANYTRGQH